MENKTENPQTDFKYLVRIANTDLNGHKNIGYSLRKIKGIGFIFANMACVLSKVDGSKKTGDLSDEEIKRLNEFMKDPSKFGVPSWAFNRRKDPETGQNIHIITSDLSFTKENDIKKLRKIKAYRGTRHSSGLPSRGQRTKSNFRKSKSRGGKGGLGVVKKSARKGGK